MKVGRASQFFRACPVRSKRSLKIQGKDLKISYPFELWGTGQLVFCFLRVVG